MANRITVVKFRDLQTAQDYLNGALVCGPPSRSATGALGLAIAGKKLAFLTPAVVEVTFTASTGMAAEGFVLARDIAAQVAAAIPGLVVRCLPEQVLIVETNPSSGVSVGVASSLDARLLFGLPSGAGDVSSGRVIGPPGGPTPNLLFAYPLDSYHTLYIGET